MYKDGLKKTCHLAPKVVTDQPFDRKVAEGNWKNKKLEGSSTGGKLMERNRY